MSQINASRRFFLRGKVATSNAAIASAVRPPWSVDEPQFIESCERCDDCITACPENILVRGDGGFPEVNFKLGECTFCTQCAQSCQAGVIQNFYTKSSSNTSSSYSTSAKAWNLNVSISAKCLSLNAVVCRACGDNCEPQAIRFQLKVGGISEPLISLDDCTGCGACLSVCPVDTVQIKPVSESNNKETIAA